LPTDLEATRLDKWLWAARFFKTRKLAADAISGGKVHVNHQRAKPGKEIKPGMFVSISKGIYRWDINVVTVTGQRRSAKEAGLLYQETAESLAKRQQLIIEEREKREFFSDKGCDRKPNKKQRRQIHRFKQA
jgi:ribosome-associated heat shock protein Hsp15